MRGTLRAVVFALGFVGCRDEAEAPPAPALRLPSAPMTMAAEFVLPRPQRSYGQLRERGFAGRGLPWHLPLLLSRQLGLPPLVAGRFSSTQPVVGAIAALNGRAEWIVGARVQSGAELVAELTTGVHAPFVAERSEGITVLRGERVLAVVDSVLLIASTPSLFSEFGPYLARVVMPRELAAEERAADIVLTASPQGAQLLSAVIVRAADDALPQLERLLRQPARAQGADTELLNPDATKTLVRTIARTLANGLTASRGGTIRGSIAGSELELLANTNIRPHAEPADPVDCEALRIGAETRLAVVIPRAALQAVVSNAMLGLGPGINVDVASLSNRGGPLLLSLESHLERQALVWQTSGPFDDAKGPLALPLAWLRAPALLSAIAPHQFPETVAEGVNSIRSSGAEESWELVSRASGDQRRWAIGVGASQLLDAAPTASPLDWFGSWSALCGAQVEFAVGAKTGSEQVDVAVVVEGSSRRVHARLPLAWLVSSALGQRE